MLDILNLNRTNKLILATFAFLAVMTFGSGRAHAATINVAGGCTLNIAIDSVNAGNNQPGCTATVSPDAYGTNDTINIPAGTQTLTANLPTITASVVIQGAGIASTSIDGDGQYTAISASGSTTVLTVSDLKITNFEYAGVYTVISDLTISNLDIDGTGSVPQSGELYGVSTKGIFGASSVTAENIYIHDFSAAADFQIGFGLDVGGNLGSVTGNLANITVANFNNPSGDIVGIIMGADIFNSGPGGTVTAQIDNTTIDNLTASGGIMAFGSIGRGDGASVTIHTTVRNATVTGLVGTISVFGTPTTAFLSAGIANGAGRVATITNDIQNSLIAGNTNNSNLSNCGTYNLSSLFGGSGGTVTPTINSLGHNISDDSTCSSFTQPGDQQNVPNITSTLGPLQNNGGPVPTRALLASSPAIGAGGQVLGITTDARGIARSAGSWDVGAYQTVLGNSTSGNGAAAGSSGAGGSLGDTGQNTKTSLMVGIFMISSALALVITKRKSKV